MGKFDDSIYTLLVRAHAVAQRVANDMMMESGVSPLEAWVLEAIPDDGRACASELADELDVPTSTVTRALRRLERYGYVTLTKGFFYDARVLRPQLTPFGAQIRDGASGFERDIDAEVLAGIQPAALGGLMAGLIHVERARRRPSSGSRPAPEPPEPPEP